MIWRFNSNKLSVKLRYVHFINVQLVTELWISHHCPCCNPPESCALYVHNIKEEDPCQPKSSLSTSCRTVTVVSPQGPRVTLSCYQLSFHWPSIWPLHWKSYTPFLPTLLFPQTPSTLFTDPPNPLYSLYWHLLPNPLYPPQDMRRKVEVEYKETLSRSNEEYKVQMNKLLRTEREKNTSSEKR